MRNSTFYKEESTMKTVKDTFGKVKGDDKITDILTGKGAFSKAGFADTVSAMANDTTFKIPTYGKDGKKTGEVCVADLIRSDIKKTIEKAKYPQKSEAGVLDSSEVVTTGLAEAIPHIVMQHIAQGKKFDLPTQPQVQGSVYLAPVKGKVKEIKVRDPKTQASLGTAVITTKDSIQIRAKSPVPDALQTKKRFGPDGKEIKD